MEVEITFPSKWDKRFMQLAEQISLWSKDQSTKVGCVIVGENNEIRSTGYNGLPRGVDDTVQDRYLRPQKYLWTEHAERNAIFNAAFTGTSVAGCKMYLPWYPCVDCARAIIQSGILTLVAYEPDWTDPKWGEGFLVAKEMFKEAGIAVLFMEGTCQS